MMLLPVTTDNHHKNNNTMMFYCGGEVYSNRHIVMIKNRKTTRQQCGALPLPKTTTLQPPSVCASRMRKRIWKNSSIITWPWDFPIFMSTTTRQILNCNDGISIHETTLCTKRWKFCTFRMPEIPTRTTRAIVTKKLPTTVIMTTTTTRMMMTVTNKKNNNKHSNNN